MHLLSSHPYNKANCRFIIAIRLIQKWVYGRGAIDDKHSVFGILEALEYMARKGERPERTVYVAFGHDEARVKFK